MVRSYKHRTSLIDSYRFRYGFLTCDKNKANDSSTKTNAVHKDLVHHEHWIFNAAVSVCFLFCIVAKYLGVSLVSSIVELRWFYYYSLYFCRFVMKRSIFVLFNSCLTLGYCVGTTPALLLHYRILNSYRHSVFWLNSYHVNDKNPKFFIEI